MQQKFMHLKRKKRERKKQRNKQNKVQIYSEEGKENIIIKIESWGLLWLHPRRLRPAAFCCSVCWGRHGGGSLLPCFKPIDSPALTVGLRVCLYLVALQAYKGVPGAGGKEGSVACCLQLSLVLRVCATGRLKRLKRNETFLQP